MNITLFKGFFLLNNKSYLRIVILILVIFILFTKCSTTRQASKIEKKREDTLKALIQDCWCYDAGKKLYLMPLVGCEEKLLQEKNRLIGKDTIYVTQAFGIHRYKTGPQQVFPPEMHIIGKFTYNFGYKIENGKWGYEMLDIFFNKDGKIADVNYSKRTD